MVKAQIPLNGYGRDALILFKFVWRQSGFAFFGALTSVGALFYFKEVKIWQHQVNALCVEKLLIGSKLISRQRKITVFANSFALSLKMLFDIIPSPLQLLYTYTVLSQVIFRLRRSDIIAIAIVILKPYGFSDILFALKLA